MKLGIKKLHSNAELPEFQTEGAACFDLVATGRESYMGGMLYGTGIAMDIPDGYHVKIYSRSGHGFKHGIRLANGTGIIDSDYTGEVMVKLVSDTDVPHFDWPYVGDRIAQAMLCRNVKTEIVEVEEIKKTKRGDKGFGSTGK